jgi:signal transduction histidine kinase
MCGAADAFNCHGREVTRTLESQRHLLSAVGHDLRTPLTAMRINLEFVDDDELREG